MLKYWILLCITLQRSRSSFGPVCRFTLFANSTVQYATAPGYSDPDESRSKTCGWIITSAQNTRVRVTIRYPLKSTPVGCHTAKTNIFDGTLLNERQIATWCGESESTFTSWENYMRIEATGVDKIPLEIEFSSELSRPCLTRLTTSDSSTHIKSVGYPDTYVPSMECRWLVDNKNQYERNETIQLNFVNVDVANSSSCTSTYIRVFAFTSPSNTELATLCGTGGKTYEFFIESFLIIFKTGPSRDKTGMGFHLILQTQTSSCTQSYTASRKEQTFSTVNYPKPYPSFQRCTFLIFRTNPRRNVKIWVKSPDILYCDKYYVLVYEGQTETSRFLGKWCGRNKPEYESLAKDLLMVFVSGDNSISQNEGFQIAYKEEICGEELTVDSGRKHFEFPGYPVHVTDSNFSSVECIWTIRSDFKVLLQLKHVLVECSSAWIIVSDVDSRENWKICNRNSAMFLSSGRVMTVKLITDGGRLPFFVLFYSQSKERACGESKGYLTAFSYLKTLWPPGYPDRYPDKLSCVWQIQAETPQSTVRVNVVYNNLEGDLLSCPDYIDIFEGPVSVYTDPDLRLCYKSTNLFRSKTQYVTIHFFTNDWNAGKGFEIQYQSISNQDSFGRQDEVADTPDNAVVIGAVSGVVVFIFVIIIAAIVVRLVQKHRSSAPRQPRISDTIAREASDPFLVSATRPAPSVTGQTTPRTDLSEPPPSYQDLTTNICHPSAVPAVPPPSYEDAISKGMIQDTGV